MKTQTGIWIDGSKALVVKLKNNTEHLSTIEAEIENRIHHFDEGDKGSFMGSSHINNERTFDERAKHQTEGYLKDVIEKVKDADELFVFGPGEIKIHLREQIMNIVDLAPKLKAVETADSMTDNQVVAKVKDFFAAEGKMKSL